MTTKTPMELAENGEVTWPRARGIFRLADDSRVLGISFDRRPTDDEMRAIHDFLRDPNAALRQSARRETDADYRLELEGNPVFTKVRLERDALGEQNKKFAEELSSREALLREAYEWLEVHCLAHDLQERIEAALGETS